MSWRAVYQHIQRGPRGSRKKLAGACFLLRDEETGESRGLFIEAEHGWPVELRRIANSFLEQQTPPSHVVVDRNGVVVQMNSDYQGRGATRRRRRPRGADGRDTYSRVISTDL